MAVLSPAVGTVIRDQGRVMFRDCTKHGLHRMKVTLVGRYPDLEVWGSGLQGKDLKLHNYSERTVSGLLECTLELYWKER